MFGCSRKFSAGTTQKGVFHFLSNCWIFRKLFLNGKQPIAKTSCVVSVHLATRKEKPSQAIQAIAKCTIVPMRMHCLYFWNPQHPVLVSGVWRYIYDKEKEKEKATIIWVSRRKVSRKKAPRNKAWSKKAICKTQGSHLGCSGQNTIIFGRKGLF